MRALAYSGLGISLIGAALDFESGYSYPMGLATSGMMVGFSPSAAALYALGIAVLASGALLVLPSMRSHMRRLGLLMELLGVVMALTSYLLPGMSIALAFAMLFVAAAMILNGALMQRRSPGMEQG